jgi:hypothetical protein
VSSKSGGTVETDSQRRAYEQAFRDAGIDPAERIVVVTDPGSPLERTAREAGYRVVLADPNVGGRYSALTAFGLVPSGLAGVDIRGLLDDAGTTAGELGADSPANPALVLAAALGAAHIRGAEKVVLADTGSGIKGFGEWAEQLIAESTGKDGTGLLPVVVENADSPGFTGAREDATLVAIGPALDTTMLATEGRLGGLLLLWEFATAVVGRLLGINPFDQPDVAAAKAATNDVLAQGLPTIPVVPATDLLEQLRPGDYAAIQLFGDPDDPDMPALVDARLAIRDRYRVATTFGIGPRFLHSTGQLHKGGPPSGVFIQMVGSDPVDVAIPGRDFTFSTLKQAQAAGDLRALQARGLRAGRVTIHELLEALA